MPSSRRFYFTVVLLLIIFSSYQPFNRSEKDFLEFWTDIKDNYAYFDKKQTDWEKVKTVYLPLAKSAGNRDALITVFENAIEELYDNHASLNTNLQSSTRLVPSGIDLWAEWIHGKAMITDVRKGFSAHKAGIKPGMEIISINGQPVDVAVSERTGKCMKMIDEEVRNFALKQVLAGTYLKNRVLEIKQNGKSQIIELEKLNGNLTDHLQYASLLEKKLLPGNIGYIKINNSLGDNGLIKQFDSALLTFKNSSALILDLRETPGGGNSTVARAIMSRFISNESAYQKHVLPNEEKENGIKRSWLEIVSPRGPFTYKKNIGVLVNHWTGSMGEGIAIGFDALKRGKLIGTKMAGLNGAISGFSTAGLKIPYSFPTEQLFHVNGTPREKYTPALLIDPMNIKYRNVDDPVLEEALKFLKK
jgi:C-terminal processing protease CtpA/Prc